MNQFNSNEHSHRRLNILTGEWVQVSPHRAKRPWQGQQETTHAEFRPEYDPQCYLCPGNKRAGGEINPDYTDTYVFKNDFAALQEDVPASEKKEGLLQLKGERGICKVICFSPRHDLTLPEMDIEEILKVIKLWKAQYEELSAVDFINYIQIFENKGAVMGCSNPHPHGQIWAQETIPVEPAKELLQFQKYYKENGRTLLSDYIKVEQEQKDRLIFENESFIVLVPFWAVWPFETMIVSKKPVQNLLHLSEKEIYDFAEAMKFLLIKYDNLFNISFPYSSGIHQSPCDGNDYPEWHFHMHFYPPLLRSASVKKFMVGYELLGNPQRDITPEQAAQMLKELPEVHYKSRKR